MDKNNNGSIHVDVTRVDKDYIRINPLSESIHIRIDPEHTPVIFNTRLKELLETDIFDTEEEAVEWLKSNPIELELYYEPYQGLFGVEPEAIETETIRSPYSGKLIVINPKEFSKRKSK